MSIALFSTHLRHQMLQEPGAAAVSRGRTIQQGMTFESAVLLDSHLIEHLAARRERRRARLEFIEIEDIGDDIGVSVF